MTIIPSLCPLHAAAPALLEALERLLKDSWSAQAWDKACDKARAAIAQAKGEK